MFCPHCGAKNSGSPIQCAACKKSIPPLDAAPAAPSRPARPEVAKTTDRLGSVGDRMLALVFDRAVVFAIAVMVAAAFGEQWRSVAPRLSSVVMSALAGGFALVTAVFLYHFLFEAGFGTTLGKAIMGLQVRSDGERGRFAGAAIRNALRIIDGFALYLVGFLVASFSQKRQRFGDLVGSTVVMEMPMSPGARGAMMFLWLAVLVASLWIAYALCPTCRPM